MSTSAHSHPSSLIYLPAPLRSADHLIQLSRDLPLALHHRTSQPSSLQCPTHSFFRRHSSRPIPIFALYITPQPVTWTSHMRDSKMRSRRSSLLGLRRCACSRKRSERKLSCCGANIATCQDEGGSSKCTAAGAITGPTTYSDLDHLDTTSRHQPRRTLS